MKQLLLVMLLMLVPAAGWAAPRPVSPKRPGVKVQDTKQFFAWFFGMKQRIRPKSEFETEEAYRKRLPTFDTDKVLYFLVEQEPSRKNYSYDAATQALTLGAGTINFDAGTFDEVNAGRPDPGKVATLGLRLARRGTSTGSYVGENAFGVRRRVIQATRTHYVLRLSGPLEWWEAHTKSLPSYLPSQLTVELRLAPQPAQQLAKSYQLLVGVTLKGLADSGLQVDSGEGYATLSDPDELTYRTYMIGAALKEILVRDRLTKATLKTTSLESDRNPQPGGAVLLPDSSGP